MWNVNKENFQLKKEKKKEKEKKICDTLQQMSVFPSGLHIEFHKVWQLAIRKKKQFFIDSLFCLQFLYLFTLLYLPWYLNAYL